MNNKKNIILTAVVLTTFAITGKLIVSTQAESVVGAGQPEVYKSYFLAEKPGSTNVSLANNNADVYLAQAIHSEDEDEEYGNLPLTVERIKAIQNKTALHQALLEDHQEFHRYPEFNKKIMDEKQDPTVSRYQVDERATLNKEDNTQLTLWADKNYYLQNDTVILNAQLSDTDGVNIKTRFMGQLIYDDSNFLMQFELIDEDGDGVYQYALNPKTADAIVSKPGIYKAIIVNDHNNITDAITYTLSNPEIKLTGNFKDQLNSQHDLELLVEVDVANQNRFYLQGSLYGPKDEPIAVSEQSYHLEKGLHWVALPFSRKLFMDSQQSGSFMLKHLSLAKVAIPIQRLPLENPDYMTDYYTLEQFQ